MQRLGVGRATLSEEVLPVADAVVVADQTVAGTTRGATGCLRRRRPTSWGRRLALREFYFAVREDAVVAGRLAAARTRDDVVDVAFFLRELAAVYWQTPPSRSQMQRAPKRGRRRGTWRSWRRRWPRDSPRPQISPERVRRRGILLCPLLFKDLPGPATISIAHVHFFDHK
jgi:hypothetical protein